MGPLRWCVECALPLIEVVLNIVEDRNRDRTILEKLRPRDRPQPSLSIQLRNWARTSARKPQSDRDIRS